MPMSKSVSKLKQIPMSMSEFKFLSMLKVKVKKGNFVAGWTGGPFLPVHKAGLELATPKLPILCSTN